METRHQQSLPELQTQAPSIFDVMPRIQTTWLFHLEHLSRHGQHSKLFAYTCPFLLIACVSCRLSHLRTLRKLFDGFTSCHFAETLIESMGVPDLSLRGKGEIFGLNP